jgi:hypothetical protein
LGQSDSGVRVAGGNVQSFENATLPGLGRVHCTAVPVAVAPHTQAGSDSQYD